MADLSIEFLDALLDLLCELLLIVCCLGWHYSAFINDRVLTSKCHLREEELAKLCVAKLPLALLKNVF